MRFILSYKLLEQSIKVLERVVFEKRIGCRVSSDNMQFGSCLEMEPLAVLSPLLFASVIDVSSEARSGLPS